MSPQLRALHYLTHIEFSVFLIEYAIFVKPTHALKIKQSAIFFAAHKE